MTTHKAVTADGKVIVVPFLKGSTPPAKPEANAAEAERRAAPDVPTDYVRAPAGNGYSPAQRNKP